MALHLKDAAKQQILIASSRIGNEIELSTLLDSVISSTPYINGIDPEENEQVPPVLENWITYGVQILGKTREWMIGAIITWAGLAKFAGITEVDYTQLNIPGFTYRYDSSGANFMVPSVYEFGEDFTDSTPLADLNPLYYRTSLDPSERCNGLFSTGLIYILDELGYQVSESTTVAQFRAMVPSLEDWLSITAWILQGGDNEFASLWNDYDQCLDLDNYTDYIGVEASVPGAMLRSGGQDAYMPMKNGYEFISVDADQTKFMVLSWQHTEAADFGGSLYLFGKSPTPIKLRIYVSSDYVWDLAEVLDQPYPLLESEGLTLEELMENWPDEFAPFVYDDAPVGLSATKKHFIRVI